MPWQEIAGTYLTALGRGDRWLYREVAVIVARQNGKTELLVPFIVSRLLKGRRIMHTAQNRELPREVFGRVADLMQDVYPKTLKKKPRFGSGQETIEMRNGGRYRIVAPSRGGARGPSNDDVIVDELREMVDYDFIAAAKPTLAQSANPQMVYLSNAGEDDSIVLNDLKLRTDDPSLAYVEWSAAPDRDVSDRDGWLEANPAVGAIDGHDMLGGLEDEFRAYSLTGRLAIFETEHLCRSVPSMRERLVDEFAWAACRGPIPDPTSPMLAVSMTPDGRRAAAALAWQRVDGSVALRLLYDVTGSPIDTGALGADILRDAQRLGVKRVAYDPLTDAELAKFLRKPEKVAGQAFANASAQFVNLVNAGRLRWQDDGTLSAEMAQTSRKAHDVTGHFEAVRMADDKPIPTVLASIRAVWLASGPQQPSPRVY